MPSLRSKTSPYMDIKIRLLHFAEIQQNAEAEFAPFSAIENGHIWARFRPAAPTGAKVGRNITKGIRGSDTPPCFTGQRGRHSRQNCPKFSRVKIRGTLVAAVRQLRALTARRTGPPLAPWVPSNDAARGGTLARPAPCGVCTALRLIFSVTAPRAFACPFSRRGQ